MKKTLAKAINPARTAVLVVDMQNDYAHPKGAVAGNNDISQMDRIITPQVALLKAATAAGMMVCLVRVTITPGHESESPARLHMKLRTMPSYAIPSMDYVFEGTCGNEVIEQIKEAAPKAVEVRKNRNSAFTNTSLDLMLRSNNIDTVLVTGMATDGCVAATSRGAEEHGYRTILLRDCVGSFKPDLHDHILKVLGARMEVVDSSAVLPHMARPAAKRGQTASAPKALQRAQSA